MEGFKQLHEIKDISDEKMMELENHRNKSISNIDLSLNYWQKREVKIKIARKMKSIVIAESGVLSNVN